MNSIPLANSRQQIYTNAIAYEGSEEQENDIAAALSIEKIQLQQNVANYICQWATTNDYKTDMACQNEIFIPSLQIDGNILTEWETSLVGNGYVFESVSSDTIRIALP